jgi:acetyl-CoA carboxylase carboxyl transferase subunit alpha
MPEEHFLEFEKPIHELQHRIDELKKTAKKSHKMNVDKEVESLQNKIQIMKKDIYSNLGPWERTQVARHPKRPFTLDYISLLFTDFIELHGDREFADDHAMLGGFATIDGIRVMVIGQQKGRDLKENMKRNFGSPNPEGYRKALRLMLMAEKFHLPVITFVDTEGANCGFGAEERGQGEAIAYNLQKMSSLKVPVISVITGTGGSGGALGIAVANVVLMLENSIYSVISPEGCAAILWHDATKASEAAKALGLTAQKLHELGLIDEIIKEPMGGAHMNPEKTAKNVGEAILKYLKPLMRKPVPVIVKERYRKFRKMGEFTEAGRVVTSRIKSGPK